MALIDPTMLNLGTLPCLPIPRRNDLPPEAAIYFVIDADDSVLYIGRATSLKRRWRAHHKLADLFGHPTARIAWILVEDHALLPEIEKACLLYFHPPFNVHARVSRKKDYVQYPLRLPIVLLEEIRVVAAAEYRSVNAQMRFLIQEALAQYRQAAAPDGAP